MNPSSVARSAVVIVILINQSRPVREGRTTSPLSHPILTHRGCRAGELGSTRPELFGRWYGRFAASPVKVTVVPPGPVTSMTASSRPGRIDETQTFACFVGAIPVASVENGPAFRDPSEATNWPVTSGHATSD